VNKNKAILTLKHYNQWRRGKNTTQPNPTDIVIAIDVVLAELDKQDETIPKSNVGER